MTIVDGAAYAVPNDKREEFAQKSKIMGTLFKEFGALQVVDSWGIDVPDGDVTSFPMAVKAGEGETVCFSFITWPSEQMRKEAWDKIMADERMQNAGPMPFDGKRMIFGTFEAIFES